MKPERRPLRIRYLYALFALSLLVAAGCANQSISSLPQSVQTSANVAVARPRSLRNADGPGGYCKVHSFKDRGLKAGTDGGGPYGSLVAVNGLLYGTTIYGGSRGYGTVFSVSPSGKERVLYSFKGGEDGAYPYAGLVELNGVLYGTTSSGQALGMGRGTVFAITTSGTERVLYRFKGGMDGADPYANLIAVRGILYGTTVQGGGNDAGTVFAITTGGRERVVHRFKASTDGVASSAALTLLDGNLYGTTAYGGPAGWGVVFELSTSGEERILHVFRGVEDGAIPQATMVAVNGVLYGTTNAGGNGRKYEDGLGTVFSITVSGQERILQTFDVADGQGPLAGLVFARGALYGTYRWGVFSVGLTGGIRLIHKFEPSPNGSVTYATLTPMNGLMYGTTFSGGTYDGGTVFRVDTGSGLAPRYDDTQCRGPADRERQS